MAAKHRHTLRERIQFQAASAPRYHKMILEAGAFVTLLSIYLTGSLVVSGGTANGTSLGENPGNLVQTIAVDASAPQLSGYQGGRVKYLLSRTIQRRRIFDEGFLQPDLSLGTGGFNGAAGTYVLKQPYYLPFALPRMVRPFDTALRCDAYGQVLVTIQNGGRDTQFTGNDRTFDFSGVTYDVLDYREYNPMTSDGNLAVPPIELYDVDTPIIINAANKRLTVKNEIAGDGGFLDALFISETTNQALADTILNKAQVFTGGDQFIEQEATHIKGEQQDLVEDQGQSMTGLYLTRVVRDGQLAGAMTGINAVLDVSNPGGAGNDRVIVATRRVRSAAA